ncbi:hypothetical protein TPY_0051 [Sulfobacillus acidophilus TPY]|nr:hypothetical protein TPY_0051 [Sulfobacillus acidophilus TPY]
MAVTGFFIRGSSIEEIIIKGKSGPPSDRNPSIVIRTQRVKNLRLMGNFFADPGKIPMIDTPGFGIGH